MRNFPSQEKTGHEFTKGKQLKVTIFDQKFERPQDTHAKTFLLVIGHYKGFLKMVYARSTEEPSYQVLRS